MSLLVMKFGGTSVADVERIRSAAGRAIRERQTGKRVVVVVSAMGGDTDRLLKLARQVSARPPERELDALLATGEQKSVALMAMAIEDRGQRAISFTASQVEVRLMETSRGVRRVEAVQSGQLAENMQLVVEGAQYVADGEVVNPVEEVASAR